MVIAITAKGRASQKAAGDLHRRNSLAMFRADGFKELERGRATQTTAGWLGLTKGRATKSAMA
jgi:hypothetical protein